MTGSSAFSLALTKSGSPISATISRAALWCGCFSSLLMLSASCNADGLVSPCFLRGSAFQSSKMATCEGWKYRDGGGQGHVASNCCGGEGRAAREDTPYPGHRTR
eukprot:scaffold13671_cov29-Tisochrysis_lutea.AAC.2